MSEPDLNLEATEDDEAAWATDTGPLSTMSTFWGEFDLNGDGAGDGRLVEGMPGMTVGVVVKPPGENLEGTVPARARRTGEA